jgi:hypothetical protein
MIDDTLSQVPLVSAESRSQALNHLGTDTSPP